MGLVLWGAFALAGCGHGGAGRQATGEHSATAFVYLHTAADANPGDRNEPLPVVIKVFQLREPTAFLRASVRALSSDGKSALGTAWLAEQEAIAYPNRRGFIKVVLKPQTKQLGVVALFRRATSNRQTYVVDALSLHYHVPIGGTSIGPIGPIGTEEVSR